MMMMMMTDWKESPRNKRSWCSSGWSSFTGLAEKTDLERLTHYLHKIETGVYHAVESWQSGSSNFITALEAEKKRVDNIDKLLASQRESILTLQQEIVQQYHERVGFSRLMTNLITDYLTPMFLTTTDADTLYDSIQLLNSGILPHHFVSHAKLRLAFTFLDQSLSTKHPNLTILIREPTFSYRHPDFQTFRHDKFLLIAVQVPLTVRQLTPKMELIKLQRIPLLIPRDDSHFYILNEDLNYLASSPENNHYIIFKSKPNLEHNQIVQLDSQNFILRSMSVASCPVRLLQADINTIRKFCQFVIKSGPLPSQIFHLGPHLLLLSNIERISLHCAYRQDSDGPLHVNHNTVDFAYNIQRVFRVPCGCSSTTTNLFIPVSMVNCSHPSLNLEGGHLLNVMYVCHYFDSDMLEAIKSDTLFNDSIEADLPQLPVASLAYEKQLQLQEDRSFDMETAINRSKQGRKLYHSLSHYLYSKILLSKTDPINFDPLYFP